MNDPVSDFLIRIKNAYLAGKTNVFIPHSKMKEALCEVLKKQGFINKAEVIKDKNRKTLSLQLIYRNKKPRLTDVEIISRPSKRVYVSYRNIPIVLGGLGITILSTSLGIVSGKNAYKNKLGGELICKIW